jgi:hypothetical protein
MVNWKEFRRKWSWPNRDSVPKFAWKDCRENIYILYILSRFKGDYRRGKDWWMDLLTTYTHNSELQVITMLSPISTLYKSAQHLLSLFQPPVSLPAVPWQRLQPAEILQFQAFRSSCHSRPCRTLVNCQVNYSAISSQPPLQSSTDWLPQVSFL